MIYFSVSMIRNCLEQIYNFPTLSCMNSYKLSYKQNLSEVIYTKVYSTYSTLKFYEYYNDMMLQYWYKLCLSCPVSRTHFHLKTKISFHSLALWHTYIYTHTHANKQYKDITNRIFRALRRLVYLKPKKMSDGMKTENFLALLREGTK